MVSLLSLFRFIENELTNLMYIFFISESNARLFVGRRRLDLMMEFLMELEKNPEALTRETNDTWRKIVDGNKVILQIAGNVSSIEVPEGSSCVDPWKRHFGGIQKPLNLSYNHKRHNSRNLQNIISILIDFTCCEFIILERFNSPQSRK